MYNIEIGSSLVGIQQTLCVIHPKMYLGMYVPSHHPISGHRSSIHTTCKPVVGDELVHCQFFFKFKTGGVIRQSDPMQWLEQSLISTARSY